MLQGFEDFVVYVDSPLAVEATNIFYEHDAECFDEEAEAFAGEFENILEQFKTLDKLNLDDVEIERPNVSVLRKDIQKKCEIKQEELYQNVKVMRDTAIEVPKIIE